jgi:hypothetical protein
MTTVFDTLTLPNSAEPLAYRTVKVRTPVSVSIEDERREVMLESELRTTADGLYVVDLEPLPESYYYLLVYPGNDIRTIIVPTAEPPHDTDHQVPNSDPAVYGYWAQELREDNPAIPSPVVIGVRQLVPGAGITIDSSDPRRPRVTAVTPTADDIGADPAGAAAAAGAAAVSAAASDASTKAAAAQSAAQSAAHADAASQIGALGLGSAATHPAADFATPAQLSTLAPLASPALTGAPTVNGVPVASQNDAFLYSLIFGS